jgi:hypothetical protein
MAKSQARNMTRILFFFLVLGLFLTAPPKALAYLDPGTGSMFLQLLLGGIAGVLMVARLYWQHLIRLLRRKNHEQNST